MEHSYSRDWRPAEGTHVLTTRTVMVHRPPPCPSCHMNRTEETIDLEDTYEPVIPSYNEEAAKVSMEECEKVANSVRNQNPDDMDWEESVNKFGWTSQQLRLFNRIAHILDLDRVARLTHAGIGNEPVLRRVVIDKSVQRIRQALASVSWEPRLTQWLHSILMDQLPATHIAIYLDILQTLKTKLPTLVDKMLFGRPIQPNQDILAPVLKRQWKPVVAHKNRKLPGQPIIVIVPCAPSSVPNSPRMQKWISLFTTMATIMPIQMNSAGTSFHKMCMQSVAEQMVAITRTKLQEIRQETPTRPIILVGFNAGAALALQVALVENVNSIICMGLAYNTVHGVRGAPDDHLLELTAPVMFVIGQNSARTSQEEIESLREKMHAQTCLVVVGSADDGLRIGKNKRQIECVTQSIVDNMVMDEVAEFATTCLVNPPGPRQPTVMPGVTNGIVAQRGGGVLPSPATSRKRKMANASESSIDGSSARTKTQKTLSGQPRKVGRPRIQKSLSNIQDRQLSQTLAAHPSSEVLNMAIASILPEAEPQANLLESPIKDTKSSGPTILTSYSTSGGTKLIQLQASGSTKTTGGVSQPLKNISTGTPIVLPMIQRQKVKVIPPNQFVQLKPPHIGTTQKMYTLKASPKQMVSSSSVGQPIYTVRAQQPGENAIRSNRIFTVKSTPTGTQLQQATVGGTLSAGQIMLTPAKYTVVKASGTTTVAKNSGTATPDLSATNIFDIPIVFADSEGNIQDGTSSSLAVQRSSGTMTTQPIMISSTGSGGGNPDEPMRNILVNNIITQKGKQSSNKVVLINRSAFGKAGQQIQLAGKSGQAIQVASKSAGAGMPPLKYTKVLVSNSHTKGVPVSQAVNILTTQMIKSTPSIVNTTTTAATVALATTSSGGGVITSKYQPIIINVDPSDKKSNNTIVIKSNVLKHIPVLKPGMINRNLTVRKVNIVPQKLISTKQGTSSQIVTMVSSEKTNPVLEQSIKSNPETENDEDESEQMQTTN